ncbi:hypothetical protein [Streptomyces sp. PSKA30]|uniref:hypothetical protein n=1 Tax=Streptomyces sp. PSKA30 TaxID=2874597 RepID=UPI001CD1234B|nr:hypothetical protein [Streptomyces sp. PSKA30]MBZ9641549.1 hypothetical protein [Streptomyces sp. PSKA30]
MEELPELPEQVPGEPGQSEQEQARAEFIQGQKEGFALGRELCEAAAPKKGVAALDPNCERGFESGKERARPLLRLKARTSAARARLPARAEAAAEPATRHGRMTDTPRGASVETAALKESRDR